MVSARAGRLARGLTGLFLSAAPVISQVPGTWVQVPLPPASGNASMAHDEARGRTVLFDPQGTWEWSGTHWLTMSPATQPTIPGPLVQGLARSETLLLGRGAVGMETWAWDGVDWTQRTPVNSPGTRSGHAMAQDAARQRVVLFAGIDGSNRLSDTWEWDGGTWTQYTPTTSPGARFHHAMAYDIGRQRVVLFGGTDGTNQFADTWEWDGGTWTQRTPSTSPGARDSHAMAYDAVRQRVVLFGGNASPNPLSDIWEWDGMNWTLRPSATGPSPRERSAMAYDTARRRVVLFGGRDVYGLSDTWEWDGSNWTQPAATSSPTNPSHSRMVYDAARRRVVMLTGFDGLNPTVLPCETWEWDGLGWILRTPSNRPTPRVAHALAYDVARQRAVLFGGYAPPNTLSDTWEWDGGNWTQRTPANGPSVRESHAMAYDASRQRVVLYGGYSVNVYVADTWEWDGVNWTLRASNGPSQRSRHAMAWDAVRQRVVLFGGSYSTFGRTVLGDTWEWDGTTWIRRYPVTSPGARDQHSMAYDDVAQRVVLYGGEGVGTRFFDTWDWDGSNWTQRPPTTNTSLGNGAMIFDGHRQRLLLHSQSLGGNANTWLYTPTPAAAGPIGSACSGSGNPPVLSSSVPNLGRPLALDLHHAPPGAPCLFGFSYGTQNLPLGGGCSLYLQIPFETASAPANGAGFANFTLPVPVNLALRGLSIYVQAMAPDPQGPAFGLVFSNGLELVIGD